MTILADRLTAAANGDKSWRGALFREAALALRDSDAIHEGAKRLSPEGVAARAEGIAQTSSPEHDQ